MLGLVVVIIILAVIAGVILRVLQAKKNKSFETTTESPLKIEIRTFDDDDEDPNWEIIFKNTDRWKELGYNQPNKFPGYGRIYKRKFRVWSCDVGSKIEKNVTYIQDTYPLHYDPKDYIAITKIDLNFESLSNTRGYISLLSGLDSTERKRWYIGLEEAIPTGIQTKREIHDENESIKETERPDYGNLYPDYYDYRPKYSGSRKKERYIVSVYSREFGEKEWGLVDEHKVIDADPSQVLDATWIKWYSNIGTKKTDLKREEGYAAAGVVRDTENRKVYKLLAKNVQE